MTLFVVLTVFMAAAGIALVAWPLLRRSTATDSTKKFAPWRSVVLSAVAIGAAVIGIYPFSSNWHWKDAEVAATRMAASSDPIIDRLEERLRGAPDDVEGWLALGQSYSARHRYYRSADAYERALDLTKGANVDAMLGLGESLALADQGNLNARAGDLFEKVLALAPQNPRALWWGGAAAYQRNDLAIARERWQLFLASKPPPDIAQILTVKISEIDQQLGSAGKQSAGVKPASGDARVRVRIELASEVKAGEGALFVLARHPGEPGPPLAVKRLAPGPWPMDVELTTADAMMPGRVLSVGDEVQVVARISRSGTATPASGDSYGEVRYHVGRDGVARLSIDKKVQ